jgi:signal transduction histidine kinase
VPIALYSLAVATSRRVSLSALGCGIVLAVAASALIGSVLHGGWLLQPSYVATACLAVAAAWFAGDGSRVRRDYLAEVERRASDAERDRDRQSQLAVAAERSRISSELHDVIAHALSVIVVQAQGAGSALRRRDPEQAGQALDAIVTTGREALAETRGLLGIIHSSDDKQPALAPQPRLADLGQLIDQVRRAGTAVDLRIEGSPRILAAGVELSAYRIIQECLTNTLKHAGPSAQATIRISYGEADLVLDVSDNGSPATEPVPHPDGRGLNGMRARAAMLGGEVIAGRDAAGGFRVRAQLPLQAPAG